MIWMGTALNVDGRYGAGRIPNITGSFKTAFMWEAITKATGSFTKSKDESSKRVWGSSQIDPQWLITLDASKSSSVYDPTIDRIVPAWLHGLYCIKY